MEGISVSASIRGDIFAEGVEISCGLGNTGLAFNILYLCGDRPSFLRIHMFKRSFRHHEGSKMFFWGTMIQKCPPCSWPSFKNYYNIYISFVKFLENLGLYGKKLFLWTHNFLYVFYSLLVGRQELLRDADRSMRMLCWSTWLSRMYLCIAEIPIFLPWLYLQQELHSNTSVLAHLRATLRVW